MVEIKKLSKGSYIAHKGEPYRIKNLYSVIIGTHSHAKTKVELEGLFSGKKETISIKKYSMRMLPFSFVIGCSFRVLFNDLWGNYATPV